jgi:hypothetical protein
MADESTVALRLSTPTGELRIRVGQRAGMSPEWTLQMGQNLNMSRRTGTLIAIGVFVAIVIVLIVLSAY